MPIKKGGEGKKCKFDYENLPGTCPGNGVLSPPPELRPTASTLASQPAQAPSPAQEGTARVNVPKALEGF